MIRRFIPVALVSMGAFAADLPGTASVYDAGLYSQVPLGDVTEVNAIKRVFGEHVYEMNLDSTKSMTGHLIGATGAVEALACIMALKEGIIPPTINHDPEDVDEEIDYRINFTFDKAQKRDVHYALSNTFGFGGHNACLIFKKWEE